MEKEAYFRPRAGCILAAFTSLLAAMFIAGTASAQTGTDHSFLAAISRAGINAHDQQGAIDVARRVAEMADSGAGDEALRQPVKDFNVADDHVDSFVAASIAAYAPYTQDNAFLAGIQKVGINAHDQQGAIDVARRVAEMADSGAGDEALRQPVKDFNVADDHVDSFVAASIAAFGS
ncbi:DUF732 domain-containing protein [Actinoallomurus oryzae]